MNEPGLASTATLIRRVHRGESAAREQLVERCLPLLRRWAHGRLPAYGRDLSETDDLVQVTLMRALGTLDTFEPERPGAFLAYLRQALLNTLRNELRRNRRRPATQPLVETDGAGAPLAQEERDFATELDLYDRGLASLPERQRQAVILRVEFGMTFPEIAEEMEMPSADAARMSVSRSLVELARVLS
ncbi:MAG: sigma-70 family RNA polymerase sigma factor [Acidobacteria bacterium]|nr:sigma-70 family RNA polymerase sigma factor [Acidobacteriota bacterium]